MATPMILIHGYSDKGESFQKWKEILVQRGIYKAEDVHICSYKSLTNEVTIKDIAEGFDRALRHKFNIDPNQSFDAMVHSTGMLVLRSWLCRYGRHERLKHLIAIAPASFGSPLAHKGRSWIGSIFKGSRERGPDFMEAGNQVLDGLELASRFTWDLAHQDLLSEEAYYGPGENTPYVFTFCGDTPYKGLKGLITKSDGTDGTVRWAGCSLNTRKITLDFTKLDNKEQGKDRIRITDWPKDTRSNLLMPFIPVKGLNHATIIEDPSEELIGYVTAALKVSSLDEYNGWIDMAYAASKPTRNAMKQFQQFVVRAVDERGDPITDFNLQLYKVLKDRDPEDSSEWELVPIEAHSYAADNSFRCFHVDVNDIRAKDLHTLRLEFTASSGSELIGYYDVADGNAENIDNALPTFVMNVSPMFEQEQLSFFYPFTTTLMEIILNREPLPLKRENNVTWFLPRNN